MPISIGAMAVNHITDKMVEHSHQFQGSKEAIALKEQLADPSLIFVAHNAPFDISMIEREGIKVGKYICTLRVAKHLDPRGSIAKYNLQYLRYFFGFEVEATAHDAFGDVLVLEQLFNRELAALLKKYPDPGVSGAIQTMIELTQKPVLLPRMTFGKHKGVPFNKIPSSYLIWALKNMKDLDPDVKFTMKHQLSNK